MGVSPDFFREPKSFLAGDGVMNFQSAYPGGAVERRRLADCETLLKHLTQMTTWRNTRQLSRELGWSRRRVREVIRAARSAIEHERGIGDHGATEDRWKLRQEVKV